MFGRAVHALAKIGEDLYVEPQKDGLAIRTINGSRWAFSKRNIWIYFVFGTTSYFRSAFASFLLAPKFFVGYDRDDEQEGKCKIAMKVRQFSPQMKQFHGYLIFLQSAVWALKSISALEKTVESTTIETEGDTIVFKMECRLETYAKATRCQF